MLVGISPVISPDLLYTLHTMGHGDTLVLADAHFPGSSSNPRVIRADGLGVTALLEGILPLITLDNYVPAPLVMMAPAAGDEADPKVERAFRTVVDRFYPATPPVEHIPRTDFYNRARAAFAVVMTGETAKYGNLLLTKGVTPVRALPTDI